MHSDDHSSTTHESTSSSASTLSTPPTSTDSHSAPWTPPAEKIIHPRWTQEVHKRKKTLAMFWRRSPPETLLASVDLTRNVSPDPSLPRNMTTPAARPAPSRNLTAPDAIVSSKRPILPRRPATSSADVKPPPSASRRIAGGVAMRGSELDRIDELDESNPIGLPLHHGGPYEAIHKSTENNDPHNIGSQYQLLAVKPKEDKLQDRKHERKHSHKRNLSDITRVPIVPAGVSLNLSPGQILPHNFYHHLDPNMTTPSNDPGWLPHQYHPRHQPQPHSRRHGQPQPQPQTQPLYQDIPINHDNQRARLDGSLLSPRHRNPPPEYSVLPTDYSTVNGDPSNFALSVIPPTHNYEGEEFNYDLGDRKQSTQLVQEQQLYSGPINMLPDFRTPAPGPRHHHQSNRLPPRMQALQMQIPRSDEKQRRSSRTPNGTHDYAAPPPGGSAAIQAGHRKQVYPPPMIDNIHHAPLFVDNNGLPASAPAFDILQPDQVQTQFNDVQPLSGLIKSSSRSIHSSAKSAKSGYPRGTQQPHHLPKRLVMPAPLQISQPVAPRHQQSQSEASPRHLGHHTWQPQLRSPSPPHVPVALDPYTESQLRAEDIQMSQGRKLRKRSSVHTAVPQPTFSNVLPSQSLSFEPTPSWNEIPSLQPFSIRKPAHKKVLSKRRLEI